MRSEQNRMGRNLPGLVVVVTAMTAAILSGSAYADPADASAVLLQKGPDRQARLIAGAKREGEVVLYTGLIVNQALRPMVAAFEAKYPFVKVSFWRGESEDVVTRVGAEIRADNVVCDVMEGTGVGELATRANVDQPYYSPVLAQYPAIYRDPQKLWAPTRLSYYSIAFNTNLIAANQAPRSYEDLLDPKWKGKLSWRVESASGAPLFITNLRLAWGEDRAMAYFRKLAQQRIVNFAAGSARTLVDRVMAGEYPIALNIFAHHPLISQREGAAVTSKLLDPTPSTAATISIAKGAPHPNAAMLLVDFFLSKEGQTLFANEEFFPADPAVPPLPLVASVVPRIAGVPENFVNPENLLKYSASSEKIYQDLFR